jgi:hypothetical protein
LSADDLRQILADSGISTVVIGAHAANRYRLEVRNTVDLDLLAATLDGAAEALRAAGCDVRSVSDDGLEYLVCARVGSASGWLRAIASGAPPTRRRSSGNGGPSRRRSLCRTCTRSCR